MMSETTEESGKKSQKRKDRQARKAERRARREELSHHEKKVHDNKPVKIRRSKKSLPGFLAKNVDAIIKWLKDYQTLFVMADDYGIQRLDRLPEDRRKLLVQNYVDIGDFILILNEIIASQTQDGSQVPVVETRECPD